MVKLETKPFDISFVLKATVGHMRKSVDISLRKTFDRVAEFDGNLEKSAEVFRTLSVLHNMRKQLDEFQLAYKNEFMEKAE